MCILMVYYYRLKFAYFSDTVTQKVLCIRVCMHLCAICFSHCSDFTSAL